MNGEETKPKKVSPNGKKTAAPCSSHCYPSLRKCPHGVDVGPLDDYGVPDNEPVESVYCETCNPRIVQREDGTWTNAIEFQYLTDEEKQKVLVSAKSG